MRPPDTGNPLFRTEKDFPYGERPYIHATTRRYGLDPYLTPLDSTPREKRFVGT